MYLDSKKYQDPLAPFNLLIRHRTIGLLQHTVHGIKSLTSLEDLKIFFRSAFEEGDRRLSQGCSGDMRKIFL